MRPRHLLASPPGLAAFTFALVDQRPADPRAGLLSEGDLWREWSRGVNRGVVTARTAPHQVGGP